MAEIGTLLGGRYRLVELLGQGGMATIYRARDSQLERDVAVKILRPEYGADPDFFARFRQEAQSAASLNHPGIVSVYDYGTDPVGPFIVMELIDGEDLASIIRRTGALSPRQAARLTAQAARAISAAHEHGFVHRDIKPGNILVTRDGRVKVTDFGIARALAESALTLPGTTLGSVHYFSPEQARGEPATPASDIYSLGIVLYELLTGRRPWEADSAAAIATARLTGAVPSPSAVRAGIPPALEAIDRRALAPSAGDRFGTATEMAVALERYLSDDPASAAPGTTASGGVAPAGLRTNVRGGPAVVGGAAAAASGAALAGAADRTAAAGVARPNPGAIDYPNEAYAGEAASGRVAGRRMVEDDVIEEDGNRSGPWVWISALLALGVLALAGFLIFRLLSAPPAPSAGQVQVPTLVGLSYVNAEAAARTAGLVVERTAFEASDQPVDTVLKQDPAAGASVARSSVVHLTLARGSDTGVVPDLHGKTETEALSLIFAAGLKNGLRTEAFDPVVPEGSITDQDPSPGLTAAKGTAVDYTVSKGPEPTPSPTPEPTPPPTPTPRPPTPAPTPTPGTVHDYRCLPLAIAEAAIDHDGFTVGTITPSPAGYSYDLTSVVIAQDPGPGSLAALDSPINLTVADGAALATCPP